jgi:hypothetical protein
MVENKGRDSMWQAISTLLSDWHSEDAEIELRNELPGGEIHAAWHLRFGGRDYFVKCDERELLPIFTAKQTSWSCCRGVKPLAFRRFMPLAAIATTVSWSWNIPLARWMRTTPSYSVSILRICISGAISRSLVWILITIFPPRRSPTPGSAAGRLFAEQRIGWQLELAAEKGLTSAISTASSIMCSSA